MLQRIHDSLGKWVVVVVLGLIAFSFIFWGVDFGLHAAPRRSPRRSTARKCRSPISIASCKARQNQYQQIYRTELAEDMRRELRRSRHRRPRPRARRSSSASTSRAIECPTTRLTQSIREIAAFQIDGQFSLDVYRGLLGEPRADAHRRSRRCSARASRFGELQSGIADSTFLTPAEFRRYIELFNQRREVALRAVRRRRRSRASVTIDDAAITRALREQSGELSDRRDRRPRVRRARAGRHCGDRRGQRRGLARRLRRRARAFRDDRGAPRAATS